MHVVSPVTELLDLPGTDLGTSPWRTLDQGGVDTFADLTAGRDSRMVVAALVRLSPVP